MANVSDAVSRGLRDQALAAGWEEISADFTRVYDILAEQARTRVFGSRDLILRLFRCVGS